MELYYFSGLFILKKSHENDIDAKRENFAIYPQILKIICNWFCLAFDIGIRLDQAKRSKQVHHNRDNDYSSISNNPACQLQNICYLCTNNHRDRVFLPKPRRNNDWQNQPTKFKQKLNRDHSWIRNRAHPNLFKRKSNSWGYFKSRWS